MDYNKIAQDILDNVGGKANVKQVTHCFTRLRFILKDESLAKKDVVEHLEGVYLCRRFRRTVPGGMRRKGHKDL